MVDDNMPTQSERDLLKRLPPDALSIPACAGRRLLAQSLFDYEVVDCRFEGSVHEKRTPIIRVIAYELSRDATFGQVFSTFGVNLDNLVLTQEQVLATVAKQQAYIGPLLGQVQTTSDQLRYWVSPVERRGTFFLLKEDDEFFVARLYYKEVSGSDHLCASIYAQNASTVWSSREHRVIIPEEVVA